MRAEALLLGMTVLWGSTFASTRWALGQMDPWHLLAVRFALATALTLAWRPGAVRVRGRGREWAAALWLSALLGLGYVTQATGMLTTTASRSAFITTLSVVFVPLIQIAVLRRWPRRGAVMGIAAALAGLWLLCDPSGGALVVGDLWTLVCAVAWAIYIVELQRLSPRIELGRLVLAQCGLAAVVCGVVATATGTVTWDLGARHWLVLIYLGTLCTFVTTLMISRYQRDTTPTRAALIYAAEPVFAALIAWATLSEMLGPWQALGATLILVGIVVGEIL